MSTVYEKSLAMHKENKGKIEVVSKVKVETMDDLSLAYTPGVAQACKEIHKCEEDVYTYTSKGNLVAVVSDGSAVLGLDGKPHTPALSGDNFFSLNGTVSQYIGDVEVLCWGCYNNNSPNNKPGLYVPTWFTKDKGKTVSLVYQNSVSIPANKTAPIQARHVHQVAQNPKDESFWIQTGDEVRSLY
ncbi:MAG: hypothetical protein EOM50_01095, partial [Erysipelotrichia bacterium]|nr:hypothetical protein [Erysipelotrichia bacterium]